MAEARERRVATAEVNRVLEDLIERNAPPQKPGEEVKLLYASQVGHPARPLFAIVCNRPDDVPEAYQRYLVNGFRAAWGFLTARRSGSSSSSRGRGSGADASASTRHRGEILQCGSAGYAAASYLLGAIPTSYLVGSGFGGIDLRRARQQ